MTMRPTPLLPRAPRDALDYEIVQEQAAALGRLGRALEAALAALADYDRAQADAVKVDASLERSHGKTRQSLVQDASDALWCFLIQREVCGLRDQRLILREYGVPAEVRNRMGCFGAHRPERQR